MKYFDDIYSAAKQRDEKTLHQLFKSGACIDTRSNTESLITPAGLLAQEGDLESAKYLVEFFGANPAFVAQGLFIAKNSEEASKWIKDYEMNEELIHSENITIINKLLRENAFYTDAKPDTMTGHYTCHESKVITGEFDRKEFKKIGFLHKSDYLNAAAHGGHIYLLEAVFKHSVSKSLPPLNTLFSQNTYSIDLGLPVLRLQTEKLAVHALSFIKDDKFLAAILKKLIKPEGVILDKFPYDIESVMDRARKIRTIMKADKVGYSQALAVCSQREIELPPLLQTSLPFFKKTTHITTKPDTHQLSHEINYKIGCNQNH